MREMTISVRITQAADYATLSAAIRLLRKKCIF